MSINYALYENHLTTDPADYAAQVEITASAADTTGIGPRPNLSRRRLRRV